MKESKNFGIEVEKHETFLGFSFRIGLSFVSLKVFFWNLTINYDLKKDISDKIV